MSSQSHAARLRSYLRDGEFVLAPGVFDMASARVADRFGFRALYMTGYGVAASHMGLPDAGLTTYSDMVDRAGRIAEAIDRPLIADADTGYGGLLNVRHTVRGYERAGVAAVQIEDQEMPKKCGHTPGRRVVPVADMVLKIKVACEARRDPDTLIVARTDARTSLGLDEALRRAEAYAAAGADILFVESPETVEEMQRIGAELDVPLLANMVDGGSTPIVDAEGLAAMGFSLAIYPGLPLSTVCEALRRTYAHLEAHGGSAGIDVPRWDEPGGLHTLFGFEDIWDFEQRWSGSRDEAAE